MADPAKKIDAQPPQDLATVIRELALALKPQGPLEQAGLMQDHIDRIKLPPPPQKFRDIPWRSEETGATGIAHVVESKRFLNGRIVGLSGYTHPREAYLHESDGGRVPDGFNIWNGSPRTIPEGQEPQIGDLNQSYKQWRYEAFYQADLRAFVGKEIKASGCQEGPGVGLKTPWESSKVGAVSEAQDDGWNVYDLRATCTTAPGVAVTVTDCNFSIVGV